MIRKNSLLGVAGLAIAAASPALASPLPGEIMKFQQLPLGDMATNANSLVPGSDQLSTGFAAGIAPPSEDLAFDLYYVPEPTSATLIGASLMIGLLARRRRGGAPIPSKSSSTFVR
jgi:hypothetical protein